MKSTNCCTGVNVSFVKIPCSFNCFSTAANVDTGSWYNSDKSCTVSEVAGKTISGGKFLKCIFCMRSG